MSALLVMFPTKPCEVSDDIESFVHLLQWLCLRYQEHHLTNRPDALAGDIHALYIFQKRLENGGYCIGNDKKWLLMTTGGMTAPGLRKSNSPALVHLLKSLMQLGKVHYEPYTVDVIDEYGYWPTTDVETSKEYDIQDVDTKLGPFSDHTAVLRLFEDACAKTGSNWTAKDKTRDQFARLKKNVNSTSSSKRPSEYTVASLKRSGTLASMTETAK